MRKLTATVAIAVGAALLGPRLSSPHNRDAGAPFAYEPPEGFTRTPTNDGSVVWSEPATPGHAMAPSVTLAELGKSGHVETSDLKVIADGMPRELESNGISWTTVRVETRVRADGTRVGLIEGELTKSVLTYRRLMLVFPTDKGTALVVGVYGKDENAQRLPAFENTINTAKGVALRVPAPPPWMNFAYAIAGAVLAWFGLSLLERRQRGLTIPPPPPKHSEAE